MSDPTGIDRRKLEKQLGMSSGYVLDFFDRTFGEFSDDYRVATDTESHKARGTSKANRMRTQWELEANYVVGRVISGLIDYATEVFHDSGPMVIESSRKMALRLLSDQPVAELDALATTADKCDFDEVAEHVREASEKNQPQGSLDRLHAFVTKLVWVAREPHGIQGGRVPLAVLGLPFTCAGGSGQA